MPTSNELVSNIKIPSTEKIPFSKISRFVISGAKESAMMFEKKAGSLLLIYTICTAIALIVDLIVIFTGMGELSE